MLGGFTYNSSTPTTVLARGKKKIKNTSTRRNIKKHITRRRNIKKRTRNIKKNTRKKIQKKLKKNTRKKTKILIILDLKELFNFY